MAGNVSEETLKATLELDGKQALSLVDKITKQIRDLSKLTRDIKLGVAKGDLATIKEQIKSLDTLRDHILKISATAGKGISPLNNITKSFEHLSNVLVPIRGRLKEINKEMAAIKVAYSGIDALYSKAKFQGQRDFLNYGTEIGQKKNYYKNQELARNNARYVWEKENPAAAQAVKNQEDLNRSIYRATNILPTYQLHIMANYAAINKLVSGYKYLLNYTVQYDEELHQLQAISGTTTGTLKQMQESIEDVAATTEFTSLELAKASTILAQAGLSATQIEGTLPAIAKLATATGTDLNTAVETITSTLNIYNLQTSEAEHVTNALTTAMNESKADISGFQQAIQYAGNLASQLGMSFDETAAAISAAAQAGIRSKSMLGTGMRATLTEMLKPTKKFQEQLASVGLTLDDVDVKSKGYANVLKTLRDAGFGAEEAFKGLNRRAAAFLVTQIRQVDFIQDLRTNMAASTAASKANEVQMDSLAKQYKTFQNNIANAATRGLEPFIRMLSNLLKVLNQLANFPGIKQILGVLLTGTVIGGGLKTFQIGIGALGAMFKALSVSSIGVSLTKATNFIKIAASSAPALMRVSAVMRALFSLPGLTLVGTLSSAIYALGDAFGWWKTSLEKVNEEMEKAKGEAEESKNKLVGVQELLQRVYDQKEKLQDQTERDIFVREILSKYPEITKYIKNVTMSYQELIETVKTLNTVTKVEAAKKAAEEANAMLKAEKGNVKDIGKGITVGGLNSLLINSSFSNIKGMSDNLADTTQIYKGKQGWQFSNTRGVSLLLADSIKSILEDAKKGGKESLLNVMSKLESESIAYGDDAIHQITKNITDRYKKQLSAEEQGLGSSIAMISKDLRENSEAYAKHKEALENADIAIGTFKERLKTGTQDINNLIEQYKSLEERRNSMSALIDLSTGERRDFASYSPEEAAKYMGFNKIAEFQDAFSKFKEEQKKADGDKQKSDEEYQRLFLANEDFRSDQIHELSHKMDVISSLIASNGKGVILGMSPANYLELAKERLSKKTPWSKNSKADSIIETKADLDKYVTATVASAKTPSTKAFEGKISAYDASGKIRSKSDILTDIRNVYEGTYGFSDKYLTGKMAEADLVVQNVLNTNATMTDKLNKLGNTVKASGPKFDVAAEKLNKFFKDLDADIAKIETTYINAEKALDSVLAKQKGTISGAGLYFGKNNAIVTYEQNRLQDIEDSQIPFRLANLQAKRSSLGDALERLRGNAGYKDVTERYKAAEDRYNAALNSGRYNEAEAARRIMNTLGSANKKYTEEEKKLSQDLAKLDESITELDTTIKSRNAYAGMGVGDSIKYGFGAAVGNYMHGIREQGLDTLGGSMAYLSTQAIDSFDSSMTNMFQNIADGSQRAGDAFKDFGKSVIKTLRDVAIQMAVKQGLSMLFSAFGGGSGGVEESGGVSSSFSSYSLNAVGGLIKGPVKNRDSVPTMLMPGEYVLKKSAVDTIGRDYLDNLNANASATMGAADQYINSSRSDTVKDSTGAGGIVNVYVVGQEQQQSMTPNDVIVTISQDMLKGGQTKKLVKSIAMGSI